MAFCTALNLLLSLSEDKENTTTKNNYSSQVTHSLSHSDHNTPFQLFKEQTARRREKTTSAVLTLFLSKEALSTGLRARTFSDMSFLCGLISSFIKEI